MSGAPAETWRHFRFATVPGWAYAFLALLVTGIGLLPIFIVMAAVSRRASSHLPLTFAMNRRLQLANWVGIGPIAFAMLLFIVAVAIQIATDSAPWWLVILGVGILLVGVVGLLVVRPLVGPRASVMSQQSPYGDRLVELRRLSPAFVAAVQQAHAVRWQHYYGQSGAQLPHGTQPT